MRKLIALLLFSSLFRAGVAVHAEGSIADETIRGTVESKSLEHGRSSGADSLGKAQRDSLLVALKDEEARRGEWSATVEGSFTGDEAGESSTADLSASAEIKSGEYPRQLRFTSKSKVRFDDKAVEENTASLLLNYDYYVKPRVEVYAFIQRFKDSFLSIQQRFEIGFGAKYERTLCGLVDRTNSDEIRRLYGNLAGGHDTLRSREESALASVEKRDARLKVGLAVSFFDELEHPEVLTARIDSRDTTLTLPSEHRFRFVVRPSVHCRLSKELCMDGLCYVKMPAFRPQYVNGKYDFRVDATFSAALKLSDDTSGNGKVSLTIGYNFSFDNSPPALEVNGKLLKAKDMHGTATLGIAVTI